MTISRRHEENHALIMSFYNNGIDPDGETREGYEFREEQERRIESLAEAGDALETYLLKYPDEELRVCLTAIDSRIASVRIGDLANSKSTTIESEGICK